MPSQVDRTHFRVERLLQKFEPGQRVRAVCGIFYAQSGRSVDKGALGTVKDTRVAGCDPLVTVAWDDQPSPVETTSVENLEPEPRAD